MALNIIVGVLGVLLLIVAVVTKAYRQEEKLKPIKGLWLVGLLGVGLFIFAFSFSIIPTGYTGVRSTFGQINDRTASTGFNFKLPFVEKIEKVNNKQQDITYEGQIWSETQERTAIYYDGVTVTYQINGERSAWIYANVSNYKDGLLSQPLVASAIKESSKRLSDTDATNRGIIEPAAQAAIQASVDEKYGEGAVIINKVTISSADFEESYNQAIAEKQNAQLEYERQQIENKKKVEAAEADAKVKTTAAQAEADATLIKAQAEAQANEILAQSLSDDIFMQKMLEKWDGQLPKVTGGTGSFMDVTGMVEGTAEQKAED